MESGIQSSGPGASRSLSVLDALSRAILWSREMLFRPFDLGKWFVLGFAAWLAGLGERGAPNLSFQGHQDRHRHHGDFEHGVREAWYWIGEHLIPILVIGAIVFVFGLCVWLLVTWLSSRGKFVFLDGVVHDRAAVVEPWSRLRQPANRLFGFRIVIGLLCGMTVLAFMTFGAFLVWLGIDSDGFGPPLVASGIVALLGFLAVMLAFGLVGIATNDFVVPLMYLRGAGVGAAWRELGRLFSNHPGAFVVYGLVKIVCAAVIVAIGVLSCCLTCCIVLLPYIGTVILLPLAVFARAFPVYLLGQCGPEYARFARLGSESV